MFSLKGVYQVTCRVHCERLMVGHKWEPNTAFSLTLGQASACDTWDGGSASALLVKG